MIRTRIAPAPTGKLHIGSAHTALFNYLFAKHHQGKFILRIDDSDAKRSRQEYQKDIIAGLKWLNITWDEGPDIGGPYAPYIQSQSQKRYTPYLKKLLQTKHVYQCFCTPEELKKQRREMAKKKLPPMYNGQCRDLTKPQKEKFLKQGRKPVIRFKVPGGKVEFSDPTRGTITVDANTIGDFVLARSDGSPLLVFTTTIDDIAMKITHTIRGEDFINLVPRQILLFQALGKTPPVFAHLQFIYGPDGGKLSKRHGAESILEFKQQGYLPEALLTFLAYLGWSYKDNSELLTINQLIKLFDLDKVQKGKPVFDIQKLDYFNAKYIRSLPVPKLVQLIKPFLKPKLSPEKLKQILPLIQERMVKLTDINHLTEYFVKPPKIDKKLILKESKLKAQATADYFKQAADIIQSISPWSVEKIESNLHQLQEKSGLKPRPAFMTIRIAVSGRPATPPLFPILKIIGQQEVIKRLTHAQKVLRKK